MTQKNSRHTTIICDRRRAGDWLLGPTTWGPLERESLEPSLLATWRDLAGDGPAWVARSTAWPGWSQLLVVQRAEGSQFDVLQAQPDERWGAGATACVALEGSGFHGLRGRKWAARQGNLHLSVGIPLDVPAVDLGPGLSTLPAVATLDAVDRCSGGRIMPGIKWVNDLLVEGAKVAGVITASRIQGARVKLAVLGVGINLEHAPPLEWTPFVPRAGCLRSLPGGEDLSPRALLDGALNATITRLQVLLARGPGELLQVYRERSMIMGRRVVIWEEDRMPPHPPLARGVVEGIGEDLSLRLRGREEPVTRGRLALAEVLEV